MTTTHSHRGHRGTALLLLLCGGAIGWLLGQMDNPREALAGLPNPVEQRMDQIQELRKVCAKLDEIKTTLKSGEVVVRILDAPPMPSAPQNR